LSEARFQRPARPGWPHFSNTTPRCPYWRFGGPPAKLKPLAPAFGKSGKARVRIGWRGHLRFLGDYEKFANEDLSILGGPQAQGHPRSDGAWTQGVNPGGDRSPRARGGGKHFWLSALWAKLAGGTSGAAERVTKIGGDPRKKGENPLRGGGGDWSQHKNKTIQASTGRVFTAPKRQKTKEGGRDAVNLPRRAGRKERDLLRGGNARRPGRKPGVHSKKYRARGHAGRRWGSGPGGTLAATQTAIPSRSLVARVGGWGTREREPFYHAGTSPARSKRKKGLSQATWSVGFFCFFFFWWFLTCGEKRALRGTAPPGCCPARLPAQCPRNTMGSTRGALTGSKNQRPVFALPVARDPRPDRGRGGGGTGGGQGFIRETCQLPRFRSSSIRGGGKSPAS